ncbi:MAG: hypothetical protein VR69_13890 [Peptococcaceae bacterium BRH_c4b]|nr:MAG: hypothetical protein VR69_13890 [Peptococcaceae bacterium BRH_c4b]
MQKTKTILIISLSLSVFLSGCLSGKREQIPEVPGRDGKTTPPSGNISPANNESLRLAGLLPKEGFTWYYNGFAEYGHRMTLASVENKQGVYTYKIEGVVDDPSGGEAKNRDWSLRITYTVANGTMIQEKKESTMLDSKFDRLEIIKTPLEKGTAWKQQVKDKSGATAILNCKIEGVRTTDESDFYTVLYREEDSDYYEKREIKEGVGIFSFEKLLSVDGNSFPAGYNLNEEASGYKK